MVEYKENMLLRATTRKYAGMSIVVMEYDPIIPAGLATCMMGIGSADDGGGLESNREEVGVLL